MILVIFVRSIYFLLRYGKIYYEKTFENDKLVYFKVVSKKGIIGSWMNGNYDRYGLYKGQKLMNFCYKENK